jgi:hypothetical protein
MIIMTGPSQGLRKTINTEGRILTETETPTTIDAVNKTLFF